jgi:hypothetical protein
MKESSHTKFLKRIDYAIEGVWSLLTSFSAELLLKYPFTIFNLRTRLSSTPRGLELEYDNQGRNFENPRISNISLKEEVENA